MDNQNKGMANKDKNAAKTQVIMLEVKFESNLDVL